MKPFYPKYRESFGMRAARVPQQDSNISGVVRVADCEGKGFAYIRFPDTFERVVGRAMPQGVGPESQVYLKVIEAAECGEWRVFAHYVDESKGRLLWQSEVKPEWLKKVRRGNEQDR